MSSQSITANPLNPTGPLAENETETSVPVLYLTLATFLGCPVEQLNDKAFLVKVLKEACKRARFTQLQVTAQNFEPHGVTGVAIIGESHIAIHTWPEHGSLFFDVASCSTYESTQLALQAVVDAFPGARIVRRNDIVHGV